MIDFELAKQRIAAMPAALGEMVKPIANLKDVRILHTGGAFDGNGNGAGGNGNVGFGEGLAGELLRVHAMKPLIDEILVQSGFKPGDDPIKTLASAILPSDAGKVVEAREEVKGEAKANLLKANVVNDKPLPAVTPQA
ncbi:conserved hypothetical protein [Bradyrhizobium sp. STM 3843]|nr:conserved hypothetical protein [Bradyrhizobium sp. STM 3843]